MLKDKCRCKSDWKYSAINYCLNERIKKYLLKNERKPDTLFVSSNMANLYPFSIIGYCLKYNLKLVFIPRKSSEDPWFCYGMDGDQL